MNKKIIILLVVILLLAVLVGVLFLTLPKKPGQPNENVNVNVPGSSEQVREPRTVEDELAALTESIEDLVASQVEDKLEFLEKSLPFNYQGQEFTEFDQLTSFIAEKLIAREDYANKIKFEVIYDFIFGRYTDEPIPGDKYLNLNNYAYYNKFKNQCPDILKENLIAYELDNFRANSFNEGYDYSKYDVSDDFYACLSAANINLCDNVPGEDIKDGVPLRSNKETCQLQVGSTLLNYFWFYSQIDCGEIDFPRIKSKCSKEPSCEKVCSIFRRQSDNLTEFEAVDKLRFQAFIDRDIESCDLINNYEGLDANDASECKKDVALWLASENRDLAAIKELNQTEENISAKRLFSEYLLEDFDSVSRQLDNQVLNQTYDFNLKIESLANHCIDSVEPIFAEACANSIEVLEDNFSSLINS